MLEVPLTGQMSIAIMDALYWTVFSVIVTMYLKNCCLIPTLINSAVYLPHLAFFWKEAQNLSKEMGSRVENNCLQQSRESEMWQPSSYSDKDIKTNRRPLQALISLIIALKESKYFV